MSEELLLSLCTFMSLSINSHVWPEAATLHSTAWTAMLAAEGPATSPPSCQARLSCRQINLLKAQILSCQSGDSALPTEFKSLFFLFLFRGAKNDLFQNVMEIQIK